MMNTAAPAASPARALAPDELRDAFLHLKETRKLRNRDVAQLLGVSEGEALAAFAGERVVRLESSFVELFEEMPRLGGVMALTRNAAAVHEKDGAFEQMSHDGPVGLALGAIDLRIFYRNWAAGFAVYEPTAHGVMRACSSSTRRATRCTRSTCASTAITPRSTRSCRAGGCPCNRRRSRSSPRRPRMSNGPTARSTPRGCAPRGTR